MINFADEPTIKDYLRSCRRHAWVIALTLGAALLVGAQMAFLTTPTYKASALVLADTSTSTTRDYVGRVDAPEVNRVLELLAGNVLSNESLQGLVTEYRLYPDADPEKTLVELAARMRSAINTEVVGFDTFRVDFVHPDKETAAAVANRLADMFVAEQRRQRDLNGDATNDLMSKELAAMSADLKTKDNAIKQYRIANMGSLPEQIEGHLRIIERWQGDLRLNTQALERARHRLASATANTPAIFQGEPIDVLRAEIAGLEAERAELNRLIAGTEALVAKGGEVEGTLREMQREYDAGLRAYHDLIRARQEAALRVGLDLARFDALFRVTEPAVVPRSPFRPMRGVIMAIALVAGLLVGAGLAVVIDYFDESFRDRAELARHTGLPVLAAVPKLGRLPRGPAALNP